MTSSNGGESNGIGTAFDARTPSSFTACHTVLNIPELCKMILDHGEGWDYFLQAQAGGPLLATMKEIPGLAKELCLEYSNKPSRNCQANIHLFWSDFEGGHRLPSGHLCGSNHVFTSYSGPWANGGHLPAMVLNFHCDDIGPYDLEINGYIDIVSALQSGDLFLEMYPGDEDADFKIIVGNGDWRYRGYHSWQGPPNTLVWKTAELTIHSAKMETILRVAKKLYECADAMDKMLFEGTLRNCDYDTGLILNSPWKQFFSATELGVIISEEPKYHWFCTSGLDLQFAVGVTFEEHCRVLDKTR